MVEAVARLHWPPRADQRLQDLMDRNNNGALTLEVREQLEALVELSPPIRRVGSRRRWGPQALGGLRDNDQVNMIGHQAICPDRDLLCAAESRDELEVVLEIFLTEERLLSAVFPLGDMVGHARSYHTCQSSHGGKLTRPQLRIKS